MKDIKNISRSRAQESSAAIERLYITMRHLFNRGFYKPMGVSGETLREALLALRPEIYGSIAEEKVELNGLLYVIERLPIGIEECRPRVWRSSLRRWLKATCTSSDSSAVRTAAGAAWGTMRTTALSTRGGGSKLSGGTNSTFSMA